MARGNEIIVSANPRGVFMEGKVKTALAPKPGMCMQIDTAVAIGGDGRFTWKMYTADGALKRPYGPLIIVLPDALRGKIATDAYAAGDRVFGYVPYPGEEINILVADVAGTGDDWAIGLLMVPVTATGYFAATNGSPEIEPFYTLEAITNPMADTLIWSISTGY